MDTLEQLNPENIPQHIAIIMDGNGRWAKTKGRLRVFGHETGVKSVREALEGAMHIGVKYLTLYAFSSENWNRPRFEINALMGLLVDSLQKELPTFHKNQVKLHAIGDLSQLPKRCYNKLQEAMEETSHYTTCTLTLALSYGSRQELVNVTRRLAEKVKQGELRIDDINEQIVQQELDTHFIPDPDLLIRTGGEQRISNFMLWQMAYTEMVFLDIMWPEFHREHLYESILEYQQRERRFGKISEQL